MQGLEPSVNSGSGKRTTSAPFTEKIGELRHTSVKCGSGMEEMNRVRLESQSCRHLRSLPPPDLQGTPRKCGNSVRGCPFHLGERREHRGEPESLDRVRNRRYLQALG
jgi:hypothetical protein